ncbi:MAG: YhbY family RNA-binding protein [Limisphaerales bacterium]
MLEPLNNSQIRKFKAAAQLLEPMLKVGKAGLTEGFIRSVDMALAQHELVKIKFVEFKEQKKELAPQLAEKNREPPGHACRQRDGAASPEVRTCSTGCG